MTDVTLLEGIVLGGDLSKLSSSERLAYYKSVCESLGLNPLTRPLEYIVLNGKLTLYARKDATDQLRQSRGVSITRLEREVVESVYVVTAYARDKVGREDSSIGAVGIGGLKGDALANAMMKAETKAKRRVTLSICGLGMLDETEIETIPGAKTPTNAELREAVDEVLEAELPTGPELTGEAAMAAAKSRGVTKGVPTLSQTKAADLVTALRKLGVRDYFKLANEVTGRQLTALTELTTAEAKRVHEAAVVKNQQPTERIGTSSAAQLHRVVGAAGVQDHYGFASEVLGREVTSYADLTVDEAFTVDAAAKKYRPPVN